MKLMAMIAIAALVVIGAGIEVASSGGSPTTHPIAGGGVSLTVPQGWHGRVLDHPGTAPVLQAATFVMPRDPTAHGVVVQRRMGRNAAFLWIADLGSAAAVARTPVWIRVRLPVTLRPKDRGGLDGTTAPYSLLRYVVVSGRALLVGAAFGRPHPGAAALASVNRLLATLAVTGP